MKKSIAFFITLLMIIALVPSILTLNANAPTVVELQGGRFATGHGQGWENWRDGVQDAFLGTTDPQLNLLFSIPSFGGENASAGVNQATFTPIVTDATRANFVSTLRVTRAGEFVPRYFEVPIVTAFIPETWALFRIPTTFGIGPNRWIPQVGVTYFVDLIIHDTVNNIIYDIAGHAQGYILSVNPVLPATLDPIDIYLLDTADEVEIDIAAGNGTASMNMSVYGGWDASSLTNLLVHRANIFTWTLILDVDGDTIEIQVPHGDVSFIGGVLTLDFDATGIDGDDIVFVSIEMTREIAASAGTPRTEMFRILPECEAICECETVVVTFSRNYGTTPAVHATRNVAPGVSITATPDISMPADPTRTGYNFVGWFTVPGATGGTQFSANTIVNEAITVYARWIPVTSPETGVSAFIAIGMIVMVLSAVGVIVLVKKRKKELI